MRLSTRTRYAARALLDLAVHQDQQPVSLREIVARQRVSRKYLEHLFAAMQAAGLVRSVRGRRGGYALARAPEEITVRDIYEVAEGAEEVLPCDEAPGMLRAEECVMQDVWAAMHAAMVGVLESVSLAELARRAEDRAQSRGGMYHI